GARIRSSLHLFGGSIDHHRLTSVAYLRALRSASGCMPRVGLSPTRNMTSSLRGAVFDASSLRKSTTLGSRTHRGVKLPRASACLGSLSPGAPDAPSFFPRADHCRSKLFITKPEALAPCSTASR